MGIEISQNESILRSWEEVRIEALVPTIDGSDRRNIHVEDGNRFDQARVVDLNGRTLSSVLVLVLVFDIQVLVLILVPKSLLTTLSKPRLWGLFIHLHI